MVVSAAERIRKYKSKFDPTVVSARFTGVKDLAEAKVEVKQAELAQIRDDVRAGERVAQHSTHSGAGEIGDKRHSHILRILPFTIIPSEDELLRLLWGQLVGIRLLFG